MKGESGGGGVGGGGELMAVGGRKIPNGGI